MLFALLCSCKKRRLQMSSAFKVLCSKGRWEEAVRVHTQIVAQGFQAACAEGQTETIEHLHAWNKAFEDDANEDRAFSLACERGHSAVVDRLIQWRMERNGHFPHISRDMKLAIQNNHIDVIQIVLNGLCSLTHCDIQSAFETSCHSGSIALAQLLYSYAQQHHIICRITPSIITAVYTHGHAAILDWFLSEFGDLVKEQYNDDLFLSTCASGQLNAVCSIASHCPHLLTSYNLERALTRSFQHAQVVQQLLLWIVQCDHERAVEHFNAVEHSSDIDSSHQMGGSKNVMKVMTVDGDAAFFQAVVAKRSEVVMLLLRWNLSVGLKLTATMAEQRQTQVLHWILRYNPSLGPLLLTHLNNKSHQNGIHKSTSTSSSSSSTAPRYAPKVMAVIQHYNKLKWRCSPKSCSNVTCTICFGSHETSLSPQQYITTPCRHTFCAPCIYRYLHTNRTCPMCRGTLIGPQDECAYSEDSDSHTTFDIETTTTTIHM